MKRTFLIDDDPSFVFLAKKILESLDDTIKIDVFSDGDLAISHLYAMKDNPAFLPDVIFLDLNMPVLDGWGFLDQYSLIHDRLSRKIALYIVTSSISPTDVVHATNYPLVLGFLIKPINKIQVQEILSNV